MCDVIDAWDNWQTYFGKAADMTDFFNFIDPGHVTDMRCDVGMYGDMTFYAIRDCYVGERIGRRIDLLRGPHWYAVLKANPKQIALAKSLSKLHKKRGPRKL